MDENRAKYDAWRLNLDIQVGEPDIPSNHYPYLKDVSDNQYPNIKYSVFGLHDTNELMVLSRCNNLVFWAKEKSTILSPHMIDRKFGIDRRDYNHSMNMSVEIFERYGKELILEHEMGNCE